MTTMAALASIPGRPLELVVRKLLPQVDLVGVYLCGYAEVPAFLEEVGARWHLDPDNRLGPAGKFYWADAWEGRYATCDDDILYPDDYIARLEAEQERYPTAVVGAWGRIYPKQPQGFMDWVGEGRYIAASEGRWVNHLGTGAMLWDTRTVKVPARWEPPFLEEALFNVWAQEQGVPLRHISHERDWPTRIPLPSTDLTLFKVAKVDGFQQRLAVMERIPWTLHLPGGPNA